jgi:hypothetical protein
MSFRRMAMGVLAAGGAGVLLVGCGEAGAGGAAEADARGAGAETAAGADASGQEAWPEGWTSRTDEGDTARSAVELQPAEGGVRVRPGPRAIYWRAGDSARGSYRVGATFTQLERAGAPESYGLFVGGRDLEGPGRDYLYFLVRQTGEYLVKHRAGDETHGLVSWADHPAVRAFQEGADSLVNELAVESGEDRVRFLVNGTAVDSLDRAPMLNTDGTFGVRINHRLDVRVTGLEHREQRP